MSTSPLRVIIRHEAEEDITDAAIWFHNQQRGLGHEFLEEVEAAIKLAVENPYRFPCLRRKPEVRRVLTNRFSYRVFFVRRDDAIVVFRVLHTARHDRVWKLQIPKE
jgi:plasmid stabilization system protein ParE